MRSYAQVAEDVRLERVFRHQPEGFYVDVGAGDPVVDSLTKHFYERGWRGIDVEPDRQLAHRLRMDRPRDVVLEAVCSDRVGQVELFETGHADGWSTVEQSTAEAVQRLLGVSMVGRAVPATTLARLCEEHVTGEIDFLKIDVEGHEESVIRGADWRRWRPRVLIVEATLPHTPKPSHEHWEELLVAEEYLPAAFDGVNRFYVRAEDEALVAVLEPPVTVLDEFETHRYLTAVEGRDAAERTVVKLLAQLEAVRGASGSPRGSAPNIPVVLTGRGGDMVDRETTTRPLPPIARPWIDSPFFVEELESLAPSEEQRRLAMQMHEQGFAVIRDLVSSDVVEQITSEVSPLYDDEQAVAQRRVQDAWAKGCSSVLALATHPRVLETLQFLYDRRPIPFQTLNFKWGTQQRGHADSIHFSCLPSGYMCGVWVALEDTDAGNGPLFYYPGSHSLPELNLYDLNQSVEAVDYKSYEDFQEELMAAVGLEPVEFHAKQGDALLWSSNIVHGGRPVIEPGRTRWSQVTHYYFEGGIYITPVFSDFVSGELLLKDIVDLTTMTPVQHSYNGQPIRATRLANGRSRIAYGSGTTGGLSLDELEARVLQLEEALRASQSRVAELLDSGTWKVGRAVIGPLARARGVLSRRGATHG